MNEIVPMQGHTAKYAGAVQTQQARAATIKQTMSAFDIMLKSSKRVDLSDVDAVRACAEDYIRRCQDTGKPPSIEGLTLALGTSRANFYKYCSRHPDSESVQYIDTLRNAINAIRISLCDQGVLNPVTLVFLLKNCYSDYSDKTELSQAPVESPLSGMDVEQARKRLIEAIPLYDDTEDDA